MVSKIFTFFHFNLKFVREECYFCDLCSPLIIRPESALLRAFVLRGGFKAN